MRPTADLLVSHGPPPHARRTNTGGRRAKRRCHPSKQLWRRKAPGWLAKHARDRRHSVDVLVPTSGDKVRVVDHHIMCAARLGKPAPGRAWLVKTAECSTFRRSRRGGICRSRRRLVLFTFDQSERMRQRWRSGSPRCRTNHSAPPRPSEFCSRSGSQWEGLWRQS